MGTMRTKEFGERETGMRTLMGWMPVMRLAEATGLPYQTLINWVGAKNKMSAGAAVKIAKALNLPVEVLTATHERDIMIARGFTPPPAAEDDDIQASIIKRNIHPGNTADSIVPLLEKALEFARTHNL